MRDIGLIVLLALLLAWPDLDHGRHLLEGYPGVGHYSWCGIYGWREVPPSDRKDVFQDAEAHNASMLAKMRPGREDSFIMEQSLVDANKGFATQPMSWEELQDYAAGRRFRLAQFDRVEFGAVDGVGFGKLNVGHGQLPVRR